MKTFKQILGEQLTQYRKRAKKSVLDLKKKSGISRQSIYDIEAGRQNVTPDQFERLLHACDVTPEQWLAGLDEKALSKIPRRHQGLIEMMKTIIESGDEGLIEGVRVFLDAVSDKVLQKRSRGSPSPEKGDAGGHEAAGSRKKKSKPKEESA